MPPMGPMSSAEMPNFNILGLLLGGRGYAANWFSKRDELELGKAQQADRAQFAQGLLGADYGADSNAAYKRAMANPYDRNAQMGLWGRMYGGPESAAALGNSLVDKSMNAIYGREATTYQDELERGRIRMSADQQLRVDQEKRARDLAQQKALVQGIFGPDGQNAANQFKRNLSYNQVTGGKLPEGMDVVPSPTGGLMFRPQPGSPQFRDMMDEIMPQQSALASVNSLQEMAKNGNGSTGAWDTERQLLMLEIQKMRKLGALDEGTLNFMDSLIPSAWSDWSLTPGKLGETKEKLRVLGDRMQRTLQGTANKWLIPADQMPADTQKGGGWMGGPTKPPPSGPARAAIEKTDKRAKELREDAAGPQPDTSEPTYRDQVPRGGGWMGRRRVTPAERGW